MVTGVVVNVVVTGVVTVVVTIISSTIIIVSSSDSATFPSSTVNVIVSAVSYPSGA